MERITYKFLSRWESIGIIIEILSNEEHECHIILGWKNKTLFTLEEIQHQILTANKSGDLKQTRANIKRWSPIIQQALNEYKKEGTHEQRETITITDTYS